MLFHYKYSKEFVLSSFGQRFANQYLRDDNVFKRRVNILLYNFNDFKYISFLFLISPVNLTLRLLIKTIFIQASLFCKVHLH